MNKSQLAEAYIKYLGPKCSKTTYYKNLRKGMNFIDALQPVPKEKRYPIRYKSKKFIEELRWYQEQEGEKTTRSRFYQRLYQGRTKEEAIKLEAPIHCQKVVRKSKQAYLRPNAPVKKAIDHKDWEDIKVKYSRDEAWVFIVEYKKMINELEERYAHTEDMEEAREINARLEKLVKEYQIFLECQSPVKEAVR